MFDPWKQKLHQLLAKRVKKVKKWKRRKIQPSLPQPEVKKALRELHKRFVLIPADKSENNVIIVCKKYFISCLFHELLPEPSNKSVKTTYQREPRKTAQVVNTIKQVMISKGIEIPEDHENLPFLYWAAKMHKPIVSERYITTSLKTVTKPLSQMICKSLKLIQRQLSILCTSKKRRDGINRFWIVKNTESVLKTINAVNIFTKAKTVSNLTFLPCTQISP